MVLYALVLHVVVQILTYLIHPDVTHLMLQWTAPHGYLKDLHFQPLRSHCGFGKYPHLDTTDFCLITACNQVRMGSLLSQFFLRVLAA